MPLVGLARRGVLLRHLVMPGALDETRAILDWVAQELSPETWVNLMGQYHPHGRVLRETERFAEIGRRVTAEEMELALAAARTVGLHRLDGR